MKLFQAVLTVGCAVLPACAFAASPSDSMNVHVPFQFVAAGQTFPAGEYRVQRSENGLILIQGNGRAAATISVPGALAKPGASTGLRFTSDGTREHLVGVQVEGEATRSLPMHIEDSKKAILSSR